MDKIPGFELVQTIKAIFQGFNKYLPGYVKLPLKKIAVGPN